jgi:hypothetical protein
MWEPRRYRRRGFPWSVPSVTLALRAISLGLLTYMNNRNKSRVFRILIDTCVWLDLAKDYQQQPILTALEELILQGEVSLIVPCTVVDEFARNKVQLLKRVAAASPAR